MEGVGNGAAFADARFRVTFWRTGFIFIFPLISNCPGGADGVSAAVSVRPADRPQQAVALLVDGVHQKGAGTEAAPADTTKAGRAEVVVAGGVAGAAEMEANGLGAGVNFDEVKEADALAEGIAGEVVAAVRGRGALHFRGR